MPTEQEILDIIDQTASGVEYVVLRDALISQGFDLLDAGHAIRAALTAGAIVDRHGSLRRPDPHSSDPALDQRSP